jgi:hypothetical protein
MHSWPTDPKTPIATLWLGVNPSRAIVEPFAGAEQVVRTGFEQGLFSPFCGATGQFLPTRAFHLLADQTLVALPPARGNAGTVLALAFDHAGRHGYDRNATREYVLGHLTLDCADVPDDELQTAIETDCADCVAWLNALAANEAGHDVLSSYLIALLTAWQMPALPTDLVGLICSAIPAWERMGRNVNPAAVVSSLRGVHLGAPKQRQSARVRCESVTPLPPADFGRGPQERVLVHFTEVDTGAKLKWFTGPDQAEPFDAGQEYPVRLTVNTHDSWKGERETVVSRVKVADEGVRE